MVIILSRVSGWNSSFLYTDCVYPVFCARKVSEMVERNVVQICRKTYDLVCCVCLIYFHFLPR